MTAVKGTPHRAQDETPDELDQTVKELSEAVEADVISRKERKLAERMMKQMIIRVSPEAHEYVRIMSRVNGKSMSKFISDLLEKDCKANADLYKIARGVVLDAESRD